MIPQLFRDVWANPGDDDAKLVLADALLAIGDPRGDFIHLQISGHDEQAARRLIQRHGMTWLGALRGKAIPLAYEKGFLASCLVTDDARGCAELATVHTVQLQELAHLPLLDEMRSLRAVIHAEPEMFAALLERLVAQRLEMIGVTEPGALATSWILLSQLPALRSAEAPLLRLSREPDGKLSRLSAWWFGELLQLFELMPPDSIEIVSIRDVPRSQRDDLQAALAHFTGISTDLQPMAPDEDRWFEARLRRER